MKAKSILERPIIVISENVSRWRMYSEKKDGKETVYFTKESDSSKRMKLKPETMTTGIFKAFTGTYGYDVITCSGKVRNSWDFYRNPEPATFSSVQAIYRLVKKHNLLKSNGVHIKRVLYTYTNSVTKESTHDIKVAKTWFPGGDPLWLPENKNQTVGIWINSRKDHIEVEVWYNNCISRKEINDWKQPKEAGFWLYPDGSISHFWKGKYFNNRTFEEKRMTYHSFDCRFTELLSAQYNLVDLRSTKIEDGTRDRFSLSDYSLRLIKKAGFTGSCWTWGSDTNRRIEKVWDLFNLIHYKQKTEISKKGTSLQEQIEAIPFDINHPVTKMNGGLLIRVPCVQEVYRDSFNILSGYRYGCYDSKLQDIRINETARIWIKDDCSEIVCFNSIHLGANWTTCNASEVNFPHYTNESLTQREYDKEWSPEQNARYRDSMAACIIAMKNIVSEIKANLPQLAYYKEELDSAEWAELWSFINALKKAPSLIDTMIKSNYKALLKRDNYSYYNHSRWDLEKILRIFGVTLSEYKERKGKKLWNNLKITKEQFHYALQNMSIAEHLFNNLKTATIAKPATIGIPMFNKEKVYKSGDIVQSQGFMYKLPEGYDCVRVAPIFQFPLNGVNPWEIVLYPQDSFGTIISNIPMKYIEVLGSIYNNIIGRCNEYAIKQMIFPRNKPVSFYEVEIFLKRGLNLSTLYDYWNILENISYYNGNVNNWERIPHSQEELQQLHDEANIRLGLIREEYNQRWAERQRQDEATRAAKYKKYLKMLQDFSKEDDNFTVVIPQTLSEIVDEGAAMHHCVGSYTSRVAEGETFVFFLRKKENPQQCYVTFNIVPAERKRTNCTHKWCMDQAFASHDRKPEKEAIDFIRQWTEEKDVEFSTILRACI